MDGIWKKAFIPEVYLNTFLSAELTAPNLKDISRIYLLISQGGKDNRYEKKMHTLAKKFYLL